MPDLKELLGDAYKEGMTFDEASAAIKDRKLVDLDAGGYVGKGKYDAAIKERDAAIKERDESIAKQKDYDDLVKYRDENEAAKADKALLEKLTGYGVKPDMAEFVKFQIASNKIERGKDDKALEENVKKFLKENPQYAAEQKPDPKQQKPAPHINTGAGDQSGDKGGYQPAKKVISHPWNRRR